jgi:hypothetical protein
MARARPGLKPRADPGLSEPRMVTDSQVRLLRKKIAEGKTIASAAATAVMSERSAYPWKEGPLPSDEGATHV